MSDTTPKAKAKPEAASPLEDLPVELLDRWAASPFGWPQTSDASEAYRAWRKEHPDNPA